MADLLFRAGIDDTPFKAGLKRLVKSGEEATKSLEKRGGVGGLLKEASAGFKAGLGFFVAQQAIQGIGEAWAFARQELQAYDKVNRSAAYRNQIGVQGSKVSRSGVGRLLDSYGVRDVANEFGRLPGAVANSLLSEQERKRYTDQEVSSHRRYMNSVLRQINGPIDEEVMRLQGKTVAAGLHQAKRELQERREQIRTLKETGQIDEVTAQQLSFSSDRAAKFRIAEALRSETRGLASEIPAGLRYAFGGSTRNFRAQDEEITKNDAYSGQADTFYRGVVEMNNSVISLTNELKQFGERIVNGTAPHHTYTNSN